MSMEKYMQFYKQQFNNLGKSELFDFNIHFIEEICALKDKIVKLRELVGDNFIIVHPRNETRTKVPESEVWLLKLEEQYKNMIIALNKIIGNTDKEDEDPMEVWVREHSSQS